MSLVILVLLTGNSGTVTAPPVASASAARPTATARSARPRAAAK
jgi:hypothetical protein